MLGNDLRNTRASRSFHLVEMNRNKEYCSTNCYMTGAILLIHMFVVLFRAHLERPVLFFEFPQKDVRGYLQCRISFTLRCQVWQRAQLEDTSKALALFMSTQYGSETAC